MFLLSLFSSQSHCCQHAIYTVLSQGSELLRAVLGMNFADEVTTSKDKNPAGQFGDYIVRMESAILMPSWNRKLAKNFKVQEHVSTLPDYDFMNMFIHVPKYQSIRHSMTECMLTLHSAVDNRFRGKISFFVHRSGRKKKEFRVPERSLEPAIVEVDVKCPGRGELSQKEKLFRSPIFNKMFSLKFSVFLSVSIYFVT